MIIPYNDLENKIIKSCLRIDSPLAFIKCDCVIQFSKIHFMMNKIIYTVNPILIDWLPSKKEVENVKY